MKKIFLTSGLVMCMSCPAFAYLTGGSPANECNVDILGVSNQGDTANIEAVWTPLSYDVTYLAGANGTQSSSYVETNGATYDSSVTIKSLDTAHISANTGYHFTNYASDYTNNETYAPNDTINPYQKAGALTLTAQFAANQTTVSYSCGTGDDISGTAPESNTATYNSTFAFQANTNCAKVGHTFQGWSCVGLQGTQTAGGAGATWTYEGVHEGTMACTAVYGANGININWYLDNTAEEPMSVQDAAKTCTYGEGVTLPDPQPTKTGYTFNGYSVRQAAQNQEPQGN